MHFIKTLAGLTALATFGLAQSSDYNIPVPFILTLNFTASYKADPRFGTTTVIPTLFVSFANGGLYIGEMWENIDSEPFYATGGGGGISFTSYHSSGTGFTSLYLFPDTSQPIGVTTPHSASVPYGSVISGFDFDSHGYLVFNKTNKFYGCPAAKNSYQITWLSKSDPSTDPCLGPLFLTRTNVSLSYGDHLFSYE